MIISDIHYALTLLLDTYAVGSCIIKIVKKEKSLEIVYEMEEMSRFKKERIIQADCCFKYPHRTFAEPGHRILTVNVVYMVRPAFTFMVCSFQPHRFLKWVPVSTVILSLPSSYRPGFPHTARSCRPQLLIPSQKSCK